MGRFSSRVDLHLIVRDRDGRVLLGERRNTGWADGHLGLPSGHLEDGESITAGLAREADEEVGLLVKPELLRLVHFMHHRTESGRIAVFFEATDWAGQITNREPDKCAGWVFIDPTHPPLPLVPYVARALGYIAAGQLYSEGGWSAP